MIIQCESCLKKFIVKDSDIPKQGRNVQCGYCSVTWLQKPIYGTTKATKYSQTTKRPKKTSEALSADSIKNSAIKASDGKTYRFLGSQWAQLLPSGKTGIFAKKSISLELNKITGRNISQKENKNKERKINPSAQYEDSRKTLPEIYKTKEGLGFIGFIFLLIIFLLASVGILKTFETDIIVYFPEMVIFFQILDEQLVYISETINNIITIFRDLIESY